MGSRARQYLDLLLRQKPDRTTLGQREIEMSAEEVEARDDVTVVLVTPDEKSSIMKDLGDVEEETKTLMVFRHKADTEFFGVGEKLTITKGGRTFFIEISEAPSEDSFSCKLLPEDPWIDEEEASKVPLLILSSDSYQRSAAEQKLREMITPQEETQDDWNAQDDWNQSNSWDEAAPAAANDSWNQKNSWDEPAAADKWNKTDSANGAWDKWAKNSKEDKSWEKAADPWEKQEKGRSNRDDKWNDKKDTSAWGAPDNTWEKKEDKWNQGANDNKWSKNSKNSNWDDSAGPWKGWS